jgi:hypothetical protein
VNILPRTNPTCVTHIVNQIRLDELADAARQRTFALDDPARRADALHGYLLALEDLTRP